jgi:hypothetical protein
MAISTTCVKCGKSSFEANAQMVSGYKYEIMFIRCSNSNCGAAVNAMTKLDAGILGRDIYDEVAAMKKQLDRLEVVVNSIAARK